MDNIYDKLVKRANYEIEYAKTELKKTGLTLESMDKAIKIYEKKFSKTKVNKYPDIIVREIMEILYSKEQIDWIESLRNSYFCKNFLLEFENNPIAFYTDVYLSREIVAQAVVAADIVDSKVNVGLMTMDNDGYFADYENIIDDSIKAKLAQYYGDYLIWD